MQTSSQSHGPRWHRRPEARPEEILEAALGVFGDVGFARARLEDVAKAAGVSKGTLYLYFDSKETLFREMVRTKIVAVVEEGERLVASHGGDARARLREFMRLMWSKMRDPRLLRISKLVQGELGCFPELAQFYYTEVILRVRTLLEQLVARGVADGSFRPAQARIAPRAIPALMVMVLKLHHFFGAYDPAPLAEDDLCDGIIDLVFHGVTAPADPA